MKFSRLKVVLLLLLCSDSIISSAQTLTVSNTQLNFGTVDELNPDSLQLTIFNSMGKTINVTNIRFYSTYGSPAFSASQNSFAINDWSSQTIWIKFSPKHNIFHNSEMVIENDGMRGAVTVDLIGQGHYSKSYYDSTENYSEEALKTHIHDLTGLNYVALGYDIARDSMFMVLDNQMLNGQGASSNTLECVYTGRLAVGYTSRTDCQTNDQFNTEHTWPQGLFGSFEPMKSDLHHLFPTDDVANNTRASYPFGVVTNASWQNGGSKFDNNTNIFEPRNAHKGETARAMLYFVLRYQNYAGFLNTQESILKQWNTSFLPAQVEITRNNKIFQWQHNLNPFVDYPQLVDRITSFSTNSSAPVNYSFEKINNTIDYGTVSTTLNYVYSFNVVNNGNQDISLSNFSLSNNAILSFTSGNANTVIPPGESHKIEINLNVPLAGAVNEQLTFNTTAPSSSSVQVPILANVLTIGVDDFANKTLHIYPQPFKDCFTIDLPVNLSGEVMISSIDGSVIEYTNNNGQYCINGAGVKDGVYILSVKGTDGMVYRQKLVRTSN